MMNNKQTVHDLMIEVEKRRKNGTGIALSTGDMVAVFEYVKELESQLNQRWISVDERLPEHEVEILAHGFNYGDVKRGSHYISCFRYDNSFFDEEGNEFTYITHWQPIPKLPMIEAAQGD